MRTAAEIKKEVLERERLRKSLQTRLAREVFDHFFCDENGQQYAGHPDTLCVRRDIVVEKFPQTADWPVLGEHGERFGHVLGNGVYLFPDFSFENPAFEAI